MADLDAPTALALSRALSAVLGRELGEIVVCRDISAKSERWDLEACDEQGAVVRRISHTQTVPYEIAKAQAELRDVRESTEAALSALGVTGVELFIQSRELPRTQKQRRTLGPLIASRVLNHLAQGSPAP